MQEYKFSPGDLVARYTLAFGLNEFKNLARVVAVTPGGLVRVADDPNYYFPDGHARGRSAAALTSFIRTPTEADLDSHLRELCWGAIIRSCVEGSWNLRPSGVLKRATLTQLRSVMHALAIPEPELPPLHEPVVRRGRRRR